MKFRITTDVTRHSLRDVWQAFPNCEIHEIDGKEVEGFCEVCNKPLFEETIYHSDSEGVKLCENCWAEED